MGRGWRTFCSFSSWRRYTIADKQKQNIFIGTTVENFQGCYIRCTCEKRAKPIWSKKFSAIHRYLKICPVYCHPWQQIQRKILDFSNLLQLYADDRGDIEKFHLEYSNWKALWSASIERLTSCEESSSILKIIDRTMFPRIYKLLQIFAVIPVTTASGERSFPDLKKANTRLRSTSESERNTALVSVSVHEKSLSVPQKSQKDNWKIGGGTARTLKFGTISPQRKTRFYYLMHT